MNQGDDNDAITPRFIQNLESSLDSKIVALEESTAKYAAKIDVLKEDMRKELIRRKELKAKIEMYKQYEQSLLNTLSSMETCNKSLSEYLTLLTIDLAAAEKARVAEAEGYDDTIKEYTEKWESYKMQYERYPLALVKKEEVKKLEEGRNRCAAQKVRILETIKKEVERKKAAKAKEEAERVAEIVECSKIWKRNQLMERNEQKYAKKEQRLKIELQAAETKLEELVERQSEGNLQLLPNPSLTFVLSKLPDSSRTFDLSKLQRVHANAASLILSGITLQGNRVFPACPDTSSLSSSICEAMLEAEPQTTVNINVENSIALPVGKEANETVCAGTRACCRTEPSPMDNVNQDLRLDEPKKLQSITDNTERDKVGVVQAPKNIVGTGTLKKKYQSLLYEERNSEHQETAVKLTRRHEVTEHEEEYNDGERRKVEGQQYPWHEKRQEINETPQKSDAEIEALSESSISLPNVVNDRAPPRIKMTVEPVKMDLSLYRDRVTDDSSRRFFRTDKAAANPDGCSNEYNMTDESTDHAESVQDSLEASSAVFGELDIMQSMIPNSFFSPPREGDEGSELVQDNQTPVQAQQGMELFGPTKASTDNREAANKYKKAKHYFQMF